jgi:hypothetical protein
MRMFYVSLVADLLGVYIEYEATSREAVEQYLEAHYYREGIWKLPWCSIYDTLPEQSASLPLHIVKPQCGQIWGGRA